MGGCKTSMPQGSGLREFVLEDFRRQKGPTSAPGPARQTPGQAGLELRPWRQAAAAAYVMARLCHHVGGLGRAPAKGGQVHKRLLHAGVFPGAGPPCQRLQQPSDRVVGFPGSVCHSGRGRSGEGQVRASLSFTNFLRRLPSCHRQLLAGGSQAFLCDGLHLSAQHWCEGCSVARAWRRNTDHPPREFPQRLGRQPAPAAPPRLGPRRRRARAV